MLANHKRSIQYASVPLPCSEARDHCISLHLDKRPNSHDLGGDPQDTTMRWHSLQSI